MSYYADPEIESDYTRVLGMRADWEQMAENERHRFLAEHPDYEQCPAHPERLVVDSGVCTLRCCAECVEDAKARWADYRPAQRSDDDSRAWIYGAGERPSDAIYKEQDK